MEAEQARLVQELLVVAQEHARVLALLGAFAQRRHHGPRAPHRLVVVDAGEIAPGRLEKRSHVVPAAITVAMSVSSKRESCAGRIVSRRSSMG